MARVLSHLPRWVLRLIVISSIFDLFISGALAYGYMRIASTASDLHQEKVGAYEACLSANASKRESKMLWDYATSLLPPDDHFTISIERVLWHSFLQTPCVKP